MIFMFLVCNYNMFMIFTILWLNSMFFMIFIMISCNFKKIMIFLIIELNSKIFMILMIFAWHFEICLTFYILNWNSIIFKFFINLHLGFHDFHYSPMKFYHFNDFQNYCVYLIIFMIFTRNCQILMIVKTVIYFLFNFRINPSLKNLFIPNEFKAKNIYFNSMRLKTKENENW